VTAWPSTWPVDRHSSPPESAAAPKGTTVYGKEVDSIGVGRAVKNLLENVTTGLAQSLVLTPQQQ
jgi:hypothetical protein